MADYNIAQSYVTTITGEPGAVMDWRALHDSDKSDPGHAQRGTLAQCWEWLCHMNAGGYGIFATVAEMDGRGRQLENVFALRAHYVDLDGDTASADLDRACASVPPPTFMVESSPGKFHVYWVVTPYAGNDRFSDLQRRLRQTYNGDPKVIDAARVMRVPGFYNMKPGRGQQMVRCNALAGYGQVLTVEALEAAYGYVQIDQGGTGERHELGDPELAAPSFDWLRYALSQVDPNALDRGDWIAITAAYKQAGWTLVPHDVLRHEWDMWCARYLKNDPGENHKQWNSLRTTELGWRSLVARVPAVKAALAFGPGGGGGGGAVNPEADDPSVLTDELLTPAECAEYFKGCVYITKMSKIMTPKAQFLDSARFNALYGGKRFVVSNAGRPTDEAWKAATRSTLWTVPKVDHLRFLPDQPHGAIIRDELGRDGVNVYKPAEVTMTPGDPSPFLNHIAALIPNEKDRTVLLNWMAHNVKFPGAKIPWAPVIQSVEGAGKGVIKMVMQHAIGLIYCHYPNAKELVSSGSKFNAWMRNKLFILADEIKVDDKRDLVEVLKPLISETRIEIESKGVDQELEDNYANWLFFTNYKDAVPISKNGRRYSIFYSPLQTVDDLHRAGMNDEYFDALYGWLECGGAAIVAHWLKNHPVERIGFPKRAPITSSWDEAIQVSRTPAERAIMEAIANGVQGFRGGWVSVQTAARHVRDEGITRGLLAPHIIGGILESLGYVASGKAPRAWFPETSPSDLFHFGGVGDVNRYGRDQGWE